MNLQELQEKIVSNKDNVIKILESLGFEDIKYHKSENEYFTFPRIGGDNPNGCVLYIPSLHYEAFTKSESGNLWTLIMDIEHINFKQALKYACGVLGYTELKIEKRQCPFEGFYRQFVDNKTELDENLEVYPESILDDYQVGLSYKFFKDNIAYNVQERFGIGMDLKNDLITIPIRSSNGDLVGVKVRNNARHCLPSNRYWALYNYSKTKVVYGIYNNYKDIVKKRQIIIVEAEKSVMQAASFNCNICVAVGGHTISQTQVRIIQTLMCKKIIVAFDEGVDEKELIKNCEKFQMANVFVRPKIGYIYDSNNEILEKGTKNSPTDLGREKFGELVSKYVRWIDND